MGSRRGHGASHIQNLLKIDPHSKCVSAAYAVRVRLARLASLLLRVTAVLLSSDGVISPPGGRGGVLTMTYFRRWQVSFKSERRNV